MLLTITVTSNPKPVKKPAHSKATYEAPITNVFPGGFFKLNKSSDVMHNSLGFGISDGKDGRDPTPITIVSAVTNSDFPSLSINSTVWASLSFPNLL